MLTLGITSCHKDSDVALNYAYNDNMAFNKAKNSYAEKFKVFWHGMNSTYSLWDYEKECGLDWDEYYNVMLPKFEELDKRDKVDDWELEELMQEMVAPLHDGHMSVEFYNHKTGGFVRVLPSMLRNMSRPDYALKSFTPNLKPYVNNTKYKLKDWKETNSYASAQLKYVMHTPGIGYQWAVAKQKELSNKENPTETEATTLVYLTSLIKNLAILEMIENPTESNIQTYNNIVSMYSFLNVPFLEPINTVLVEGGIDIKYALFEDNIAYLYISDFSLTTYLNDLYFERFFSGSKHDTEVATRVKDVYNAWFGAIQRLHKQKQLKGVVIDLRSNGGGMVYDSNYVLGSLAPQGGIQYGYARFKRGAGRYDYSPLMPQSAPTMADEHEIIDDVPITILINCWSVSMSEMTSLCAKQLPNARVVGTRSWGGLCALSGQEDFTVNYTGHIGVKNQTPVYVYLPMVAIYDMNKKVLEGYGVEPDIEVSLDAKHLNEYDTQLERALDYIRTGN